MSPEPASGFPFAGVGVPPPSMLDEAVPAPRAGFVWIPGYWGWNNERHVWHPGHWVPARQGCHWRRHRWVLRGGSWYLEAGAWVSDETRGAHEMAAKRAGSTR